MTTRATLLAALLLAAAPAAHAGTVASYRPSPGHRLAGFALDVDRVVLAEDPGARGTCAVVRHGVVPGALRRITPRGGTTCSFGGRFYVRYGMRAIGVALDRAMWTLVRPGAGGSSALAVKGSTTEPEVVLGRVDRIGATTGPFLGPVVASDWLRLFGRYEPVAGGDYHGVVISGNANTIWDERGPVLPVGIDPEEHVVVQGRQGQIAVFHAHSRRRFGRVDGARARAASVYGQRVVILRSDRAALDVRDLDGRLLRSFAVSASAKPLLDLERGVAVYLAGRDVHALRIATGTDRVVASAPVGSILVDAQVERGLLAYGYRNGPAGRGVVDVIDLPESR